MIEIRQTIVYSQWFSGLRDRQARARILARICRLSLGNRATGARMIEQLDFMCNRIGEMPIEPQGGFISKPRVSEAPPWESAPPVSHANPVGVPCSMQPFQGWDSWGDIFFPGWRFADPGLCSGTPSAFFSHLRTGHTFPIKPRIAGTRKLKQL
jgi:hypothetical protein